MSEIQIQQMQELLKKSLIKIKQLENDLSQKYVDNIPTKEDIAIIGHAFAFPNGIDTLDKLWSLLYEKKDAVSKIPNTRFNVGEIFSTDVYANGKTNSPYGTFLDKDVSLFDADFFGIPPREAKSIDPIQRILLQLTYEAFENAGIATQKLKGKNIGVFVAVGLSDYAQARLRSGNLEDIDVYDATGIPFATICGRISYSFDFNGQSIAIDTACSSVLSAIHQAQHALQNREIDMAVIASANLLLTPEIFVALTKMGSVSPTGTTKAFAENADGYIRGEGAAILILKRNQDAIDNQDNIELIIKSSVIKHNGTSNGFTAPNPSVQVATIQEALQQANLTIDDIDYVESHGIGNKTTDAMEVQAIHQAFKNKKDKINVGSVKANIGHLEACTGMPMLFKIMTAMQHQTMPAQINIQELNQDVDWQNVNVNISREHQNWTKQNKIASINLSGYSGTNAHLILQNGIAKNISDAINAPYIFNLSAKTENALVDLAKKYITEKEIWSTHTLTEICYTLNNRNIFDYKLSINAENIEQIIQALEDFINKKSNPKLFFSSNNINNICFQFAGQGSQYFGMCKKYYQTFDVFKQEFDLCNNVYNKLSNNDLKNIIWEDATNAHQIHETQYTQIAIFTIEYALTKFLMHYGVQPNILIGHSIGEIVAMCVANVFSLEDAINIVYQRATLMQSIQDDAGTMAAVFCNAGTIEQINEDNIIEIAGYNTQNNTTITGTKENIATFMDRLKTQNIKAVPLQVSHAFHSKQMDSIVAKFQEKIQHIQFSKPTIPIISNIDGNVLETIDALYLAQQLRVPVQYMQGVQTIAQQFGNNIFVECCSNPVLSSLAKNILNNNDNIYVYTSKHQSDDVQNFYTILQTLYCQGININWDVLYQHKKINRVRLPNYAWQEKSYWYNPNRNTNQNSRINTQESNNIRHSTQSADDKIQAKNKQSVKRENLLVTMQIEAAKILGLEAGQMLDINKPYREQGFDSMMSGEFLAKMENLIGAGEIKMDVIHNHPTPKELHQYLIDTYFGGGEVDTSQAISMADLMFNSEMDSIDEQDWHTIKATDGKLLKWFKNFDKKLPKVK
jgi:acyl transferase domain-containing protein